MGERPVLRVGKGRRSGSGREGCFPKGPTRRDDLEHASVIDRADGRSALKPSPPGKTCSSGRGRDDGEAVLPRGTVSVPRIWGRWPMSGSSNFPSSRSRAWPSLSTGGRKIVPGGGHAFSRPDPGHQRLHPDWSDRRGGGERFTGDRSDDPGGPSAGDRIGARFRRHRRPLGEAQSAEGHDARSVERDGQAGVFLHGVSIRPGKPVLAANMDGSPSLDSPAIRRRLPSRSELFVEPVIEKLGRRIRDLSPLFCGRSGPRLSAAHCLVHGEGGLCPRPPGREDGRVVGRAGSWEARA